MKITADYIEEFPFGELCDWANGECLRAATWDEYCLSIRGREYALNNELLVHGKIMVRGTECFVWTAECDTTEEAS